MPGKRSRTRTQAITVPITTLTAVTSSDWMTVSSTADRVCELVIVSTKPETPSEPEVATTMASGISTSRLNHSMAAPSPRPEAIERARLGRPALARRSTRVTTAWVIR